MAILFDQAVAAIELTSPTWVDIDLAVATSATGTWLVMFSAVFVVPREGRINFRVVADGEVAANSERGMDVGAYGLKNERCVTLEMPVSPGSAKVVKIQARCDYGSAILRDRRLSLFQ